MGARNIFQCFGRYPIAFLQLFTCDKSFKNNPIIGSRLLNLLGLHVCRVVLSHLFFTLRLLVLSPLVSREHRKQFRRDGYLRVEGFLPVEQFLRLKEEVHAYKGSIREEYEGDTITQRLYLTQSELSELKSCEKLFSNDFLFKLLRYSSSKNRIPLFNLENIVFHGKSSQTSDPQMDLHADTFHPCVKAWLYLDDVTDSNGPFTFVPGSHRLTLNRLKWEYQQSLIASCKKNNRPKDRYWDGSFRVNENDLQTLGYQDPIRMTVPANTLVVANVRGFHRRGEGRSGATRLSIWMQARDNPFFTPFPKLTAMIVESIWKIQLKKITAKHVSDGSWGIVSGGFTAKGNSGDL